MFRKLLSTLAVALGAGFAAAPASAVITVSFEPATQHVATAGDPVSVDLRISGLGTEVLSGFDLNVLFDSAILSTGGSVTFFNGDLGNPWFLDAEFNVGDRGLDGFSMLFDDDALAAVQTDDSFVFARIGWTTLADGFTLLNFGPDPDFQRNITGRNALSLDVDFGSACISVGTGNCDQRVPEPSAVSLAGLGLAGMLGVALRRRRPRATVAA